jgi:hypothetical protein
MIRTPGLHEQLADAPHDLRTMVDFIVGQLVTHDAPVTSNQ